KSRIFESKWTKLFILTSTIQAIVIIALEIRVFFRNSNAGDKVVEYMVNNTGLPPEVCTLLPSAIRINNIQEENVVFMSQILEVRKWYEDLKVACPGILRIFELSSKNRNYDLPLLGSELAFASLMAYLSFKLYQEFGWNIYKRIGADIQIQGSAIEACVVYGFNLSSNSNGYGNITSYRYFPRSLLLIHMGVTILIFFNQLLAYYSVYKECKSGMIIVNLGWLITVLDLILILKYSIGTVSSSCCGIITALVTLICSIMIIRNFEKGLHTYGNDESKEYERWSIDDD
ncbi:6192_t:CDS:2, partial [Entrophospora sp. SA101]